VKKAKLEGIIGGVLALLVVVFALVRLAAEGLEPAHIMSALITICGVVVSLLVLISAARSFWLAHRNNHNFADTLSYELRKWLARNHPMILASNSFDGHKDSDGARYSMLKQFDTILRRHDDFNGSERVDFLTLPASFNAGDKILVHLAPEIFTRRALAQNEDVDLTVTKLTKDMANCISAEFPDLVKAHGIPQGKVDTVTVILAKTLDTPEEARELVKMLNYIVIVYLACA